MSRLLLVGLVVAMMSCFLATDSFAQRDAGAKARGDNEGFWDSRYNRSPARTLTVAPRTTQGYRSFSYEPGTQSVWLQPRRYYRQPMLRGFFGRRLYVNRAFTGQSQGVNRGYRSFSYEPQQAQGQGSVNRGQSSRELWRYQKTNPRRYRQGG
jgi:hypothetical protein